MIRNRFGERSILLSASLYLVVSLVCTQLPLLNYLGYEFSVAIALLGSFVAGFLTIKSVRQSYVPKANSQQPIASVLLSSFKQSLFLNLSLLVIPIVVMIANAFFVKNCSISEGAGYFILLPVVSVLFSSSLGFFCAAHYRWAKTIFTIIVCATLAEVVAVGYFTPAIFSYNLFYGYFPGLTYDEVLGIGWSLVLFRCITIILAGVLVWMAMLILRNTTVEVPFWKKGITLLRVMVQGRSFLVTAGIVAFTVVIWLYKGELGFDSTSSFIQRKLGKAFETEHFKIFYASESYDSSEIKWIAAEHEFRLKQIADELALPLKAKSELHEPPSQKIESYIYPSSEVKQRLIGAGNTNIAKPWNRQIHITRQSLNATMKHELAHVLVAPFGLPIINASLSTGLVEGVAMAIEWDWGNRTLHQYSAAMRKFKVGPDISALMTITGFASQSSSISYVLAGSFCRYLIGTYGIRKMMLLYHSSDYDEIYDKPLSALITEWQTFLDKIPVADQDRDAVDVLFRRPAIFRKVCARVVAARNVEAAQKFRERNYSVAAELYHQSFEDGRGYDALGGYIASMLYARDFGGVVAAFDSVIRPSQNASQYIPLFINVGLAHVARNDLVKAEDLFRRVAIADLGESLTEASLVCSAAFKDTANREMMVRYLLTAASDSQRVATLDSMKQHPVNHWLPMYLRGKVLSRQQRWHEALNILKRLEPRVPENTLEAIRLKTIGFCFFRLGQFEEAKQLYWQSLNFIDTEVAKNEVNDWVERCEWIESNSRGIK